MVSLANPAHQKTDIPDGFFRVEALSVCGLLNWTVRTIALPGPNSVGAPWVLWERPSNCLWRIPILKGSLRVPFLGFAKRATKRRTTIWGAKPAVASVDGQKIHAHRHHPPCLRSTHQVLWLPLSMTVWTCSAKITTTLPQTGSRTIWECLKIGFGPVETLSGGFPLFKQAGNTCSSGLERLRFACFLRQICGLLRQ